jgi:hypothetical protein
MGRTAVTVMKTVMTFWRWLCLTGWLVVPLMAAAAEEDNTPATQTNATIVQIADYRAPTPDNKRLLALAMIETGVNDREIGGQGEISRYQLSPAVWRNYTDSDDYTDPQVSMQVAGQHWRYLANYFKQKTGREPDDFDMYVLWNTRYGYYEKKGFSQHNISPVIQDRAARFVNLVNRKT